MRDRSTARLRGAPGHVIGLVIPDIHCSFFPDLVSGIQRAADAAGYVVLLAAQMRHPETQPVQMRLPTELIIRASA